MQNLKPKYCIGGHLAVKPDQLLCYRKNLRHAVVSGLTCLLLGVEVMPL
jgi:hypothetical protein